MVLLVPAFFRPNVEPPIYSTSLSRSALEVRTGDLARVDLQLLKMIDAAKNVVSQKESKSLEDKVFLFGFSASAMFVNRFTFIHPERIAAAALGAPGGWPIAPVKKYKRQNLKYPVGIYDLDKLAGSTIDLKKISSVPMFLFLGERDENDSVIYRDSYSKENETQIFSLFGKKPVARWPVAEKLYKSAGLKADFKIYKDIGHETNKTVHDDLIKFFKSHEN
jgi:predicted esterase